MNELSILPCFVVMARGGTGVLSPDPNDDSREEVVDGSDEIEILLFGNTTAGVGSEIEDGEATIGGTGTRISSSVGI